MSKLVVANIQNYTMLCAAAAAVVASTVKVETAADYANKIKQTFGGKLEIVPQSVRNVSQDRIKAVAFHVRAVTESRPFEAAAQMRTVVEANIFADDDDATWQVVEASGVKRLVKQSDTDISALLAAASKLNITRIAASNFDLGVGPINQGEFVIFTNPETASADTGIALYDQDGGFTVLARSTGKLVPTAHSAVIAHSAFDADVEDGDETAAMAFDATNANSLIAYYRDLYSTQPGFFAQLETMIRKRFLLA